MIKRLFLFTTLLLILVFLMPLFMVLRGAEYTEPHVEYIVPDIPSNPDNEQTEQLPTIDVEFPDGAVEEMSMNEYIFSVLAGEMEPTAHIDALKAQVVAIRTFAHRNIIRNREHDLHISGADICANHTHCLAFRPRDEAITRWQAYTDAEYNETKFERAINETDGVLLLYSDLPILSVYHAISAGHTENIIDVWGGNHPYLSGVTSAGCKNADGFTSEVTLSIDDFGTKISTEWSNVNLSAAPDEWITDIERSPTGGIITASLGGIEIRGVQLRNLVGLRSANFTFEVIDENITFHVRGWGHGVGMSQQGAIAMAEAGYNWRTILEHYYPGAVLGA